jgi:putative addiction module antidote
MKTAKLKVRKIGNSLGVILSKEAVEALQVQEDSTLYLTDAPTGLRVTAEDPEFAEFMAIVDEGSRRYRNALRELAK